jgi:hypothetical protein
MEEGKKTGILSVLRLAKVDFFFQKNTSRRYQLQATSAATQIQELVQASRMHTTNENKKNEPPK